MTQATSSAGSLVGRALSTIVILLVAYTLFREFVFDPFPGAFGSILGLSLFPVLLVWLMWSVARCRDEVQRASAFEGYAWGAIIGLGLIQVGVILVLFLSGVSDWLQAHALAMHSHGGPNPASIGFGFGAMFSIIAVGVCMSWSRAIWWMSKR